MDFGVQSVIRERMGGEDVVGSGLCAAIGELEDAGCEGVDWEPRAGL